MIDDMVVSELLEDFRSIKLSKKMREFIDNARVCLQDNGNLPIDIQDEVRRMAKRYNRQFKELYAAREKARRSNWKRREGIKERDAVAISSKRDVEIMSQKNDLGI